MEYFLAIDVGGTKIIATLFKEKDMICIQSSKSDTRDAETMFESLTKTIDDLLTTNDVAKKSIHTVGLVIPGQIDFTNERAVFQNNLPWKDFPIGKRMRQMFPQSAFILKHDVQSATIGEWCAKDQPNGMFLYVTVSTGLSASMMYQGKVLSGNGFSGEIGYMKDEQGKKLEKCASGSAMEREVQSMFSYQTLKEAFDAFNSGDKEMNAYFSEKAKLIARSLYNVFTMIDPDMVVIGGGVINNQERFYQMIIKHFKEFADHLAQKDWSERISKSTHTKMSGIYGLLE